MRCGFRLSIQIALSAMLIGGPAAAASLDVNWFSASEAEVEQALGTVLYQVTNCPTAPTDWDTESLRAVGKQRRVKVTIARDTDAYRDPKVLSRLLRTAKATATRDCAILPMMPNGHDLLSVTGSGGSIDIYTEASAGGEHLVHVENYGDMRNWGPVHDVRAEREEVEAEARAEEARQAQLAHAAEAAALRQEARGIQQQRSEAESAAFWGGLWTWIKLIFWSALLLWLFSKRESIARWYYSLSPHPAREMVNSAIYHGSPIDGGLYQGIIDQTGGGPIENEVRTRQANELTTRLRQHEAALRAQSARQMRAAEEMAARENAFARAHLELMRAGVSHEDAAARLDELKRSLRT